jgi:hypothetical protein
LRPDQCIRLVALCCCRIARSWHDGGPWRGDCRHDDSLCEAALRPSVEAFQYKAFIFNGGVCTVMRPGTPRALACACSMAPVPPRFFKVASRSLASVSPLTAHSLHRCVACLHLPNSYCHSESSPCAHPEFTVLVPTRRSSQRTIQAGATDRNSASP